jgi:hypothetical protein
MNLQSLSPIAQRIETDLDSSKNSSVKSYLRQDAFKKLEDDGFVPAHYNVFATRSHPSGNEIIPLGSYTESTLLAKAFNPQGRFVAALRNVSDKAESILSLDPTDIQYCNDTTLFWADVVALKSFLGSSLVIDEILAELLTARFQMLRRDTPPEFLRAIREGLKIVLSTKTLDTTLVIRMVTAFDQGGFDSFAPEALRKSDDQDVS